MRIRPGTASTALGLVGVGIFIVTPAWLAPWLGWGFIASALVVFVGGIEVENGHLAIKSLRGIGRRLRTMWPQILILTGALLILVGLAGYLRPSQDRGPQAHGAGFVSPPNTVKVAKAITHAVLRTPIPEEQAINSPPPKARPQEETAHDPALIKAPTEIAKTTRLIPGIGTSRLSLTGVDYIQQAATDPNTPAPYVIRIKYRNLGAIPANAPVTAAPISIVETKEPLTDQQIQHMADVVRTTYLPVLFDQDRAKVETDREYQRDVIDILVSASDMKAIRSGEKTIYIAWGAAYIDEALGPHQYWIYYTVISQSADLPNYAFLRANTELKTAP